MISARNRRRAARRGNPIGIDAVSEGTGPLPADPKARLADPDVQAMIRRGLLFVDDEGELDLTAKGHAVCQRLTN